LYGYLDSEYILSAEKQATITYVAPFAPANSSITLIKKAVDGSGTFTFLSATQPLPSP
jgi:hypothetical protein